MATPAAAPAPTLRGDRAFRKFWTAGSVSLAGTLVTSVVLPILIYQRTGSAWQTSLLVAIETIPYLAIGLVAGAVADRVDRRRLMWRCELVSALLVGSIPLAAAAGVLSIAQVYLVAAGTATVFVWFDAANFGALPAIAGRDRIAIAYARLSASSSVLMIVAPALGGVLASTIGPASAMAIDAASYVVSALLLLSIRRPFSVPGPAWPSPPPGCASASGRGSASSGTSPRSGRSRSSASATASPWERFSGSWSWTRTGSSGWPAPAR